MRVELLELEYQDVFLVSIIIHHRKLTGINLHFEGMRHWEENNLCHGTKKVRERSSLILWNFIFHGLLVLTSVIECYVRYKSYHCTVYLVSGWVWSILFTWWNLYTCWSILKLAFLHRICTVSPWTIEDVVILLLNWCIFYSHTWKINTSLVVIQPVSDIWYWE